MTICYVVLDKLKKAVPESAMYRLYTEEKIKYIMELTDETPDIRELEEKLGRKPFSEIENLLFNYVGNKQNTTALRYSFRGLSKKLI